MSRPYFDADGDNSAQAAQARGGRLQSMEVSNPSRADAFIQLFDALTGDVTVGTTTPTLSFFVPRSGAMDKDFGVGIEFSIGIAYACTTTATGNTDPSTGLVINMAIA